MEFHVGETAWYGVRKGTIAALPDGKIAVMAFGDFHETVPLAGLLSNPVCPFRKDGYALPSDEPCPVCGIGRWNVSEDHKCVDY